MKQERTGAIRKSILTLIFLSSSLSAFGARPVVDPTVPTADDYTVLAGRVTIGTIDAHTVGVVVDDGGNYRHLFRLWTESSVKTFRAISQSASVEFRGDELIVMAADQEWFYALVTASGDSRAPRQPAGFTATRYVGYGLNHQVIPLAHLAEKGLGLHVAALDFCEDFDACTFNLDTDFGSAGGGGGGGSCDSGGAGASSCSVANSHGSCSVTCTSSSYACCTAATTSSTANCRCKF